MILWGTPELGTPMKTVLIFTLIGAIAGLLTVSSPAQIVSFVAACALLAALVMRRKRQSDLSLH
jgi:hypothetical protein